MFKVKEISLSEIYRFSQQGDMFYKPSGTHISTFLEKLGKLELGKVHNLDEKATFNDDDLEGIASSLAQYNSKLPILDLIKATLVIREAHKPDRLFFINVNKLDEIFKEKNVIILSATPMLSIYESVFGKDNIEIIDISDIESQGKVIQYTAKSFSRSSFNKSTEQAKELVGNKTVITFKGHRSNFPNASEMYFGNVEGYDELNGKDFCVFGTPFPNQSVVLLYGKAIGITIDDEIRNKIEVTYKRRKFQFSTFSKNMRLQRLHLELIEKELLQAVFRGRTLRNNNTVEVYSSLPLRIADEYRMSYPRATTSSVMPESTKTVLESGVKEENIIDVITSHHMDYESHFDEQDEEIRMLNQEFREGRTPIFTKTGGRTEDRKKRLSDNDRVTARVPFLYHSESGKNRKVFECVLKNTFGD